jgi:hypothetical protein
MSVFSAHEGLPNSYTTGRTTNRRLTWSASFAGLWTNAANDSRAEPRFDSRFERTTWHVPKASPLFEFKENANVFARSERESNPTGHKYKKHANWWRFRGAPDALVCTFVLQDARGKEVRNIQQFS